MASSFLPVTERANKLSENIDTASPWEIINTLHACNAEIFDGWQSEHGEKGGPPVDHIASGGLRAEEIIAKVEIVVEKLTTILETASTTSNAVVFSGCGTSGRIAFMAARRLRKMIRREIGGVKNLRVFHCMAGGDRALFVSSESPEDDWEAGVEDLLRLLKDADVGKVLYIGISCGFSANFVAGQLEFCLDHLDKFFPVAMGFNPIRLSRKYPSYGNRPDRTFHNILRRMEKEGIKALILNPIIGPEPISGSSRMKGGSATKILLDAIIVATANEIRNRSTSQNPRIQRRRSSEDSTISVANVVQRYHRLLLSIQERDVSTLPLARVIEWAGQTLRRNGRIIYLSSVDPEEALTSSSSSSSLPSSLSRSLDADVGLLCLIDASECQPTFGATFEDVRGFLKGVESGVANEADFRSYSLTEFATKIVPTLTSDDLLIFVGENPLDQKTCSQLEAVSATQKLNFMKGGLKIAHLQTNACDLRIGIEAEVVIVPPRPAAAAPPPLSQPTLTRDSESVSSELETLLDELDMKWKLNAISTGAHIIKGKIFHNFMVDVQVSNEKLFRRAVGLVQQIVPIEDERVAKDYLLKSIYETNESIDSSRAEEPVGRHVERATKMQRIVPTAIVMAKAGMSVNETKTFLYGEPILRRALVKIANEKS